MDSRELAIVKELTGIEDDTRISFNDVGWTSRVYLIDDGDFVFKFPRTTVVKKEYHFEVKAYRLLESLQSQLSFPIISWLHHDYNYIGYRGVKGSSLDDSEASLSQSQKKELGKVIGSFLKEFHHLHIETAPQHTLHTEVEEFKMKHLAAEAVLKENFDPSAMQKIKTFVHHEYPQRMELLDRKQALCHGDLGVWNIIVHVKNETAGIIDFGDVAYYDSAIDFSGLRDEYLLEGALESYGETKSLREAIQLRMAMIPILDIPYYYEKKKLQHLEHALSLIELKILRNQLYKKE